MPTVYCDSEPLSVALHNVSELMPKRNSVPWMALQIHHRQVLAMGSLDNVLFATDTAPVLRSEGWGDSSSWTLLVTLDDLTAMEKASREADKGTQASLAWDKSTVTLTVQKTPKDGGTEDVIVQAVNHSSEENHHHIETYWSLLEMLSVVDRPARHALARGYFSKLDKLKTSSRDHPLSLAIPDEYSPWFVKCGPTFRGMVAPVSEETYEQNHGPEGLW